MSETVRLISANDDATTALGRVLAGILRPGHVVALTGDLGAGKTVICRGIARGLGVTGHIPSPTFTLVQEYPLKDGNVLYHLDMYRIDDENAAIAFGVDEYLFAPTAIGLVEWSERIAALLDPEKTLRLHIIHRDEASRMLEFTGWPDALKDISLPDGISRA